MTRPFAEAAHAASAAIDEVMGEPLRIEPRSGEREFVPAGADPARGPIEVIGVVTRHSAVLRQLGAGANSREHLDLAEGRLRVSIAVASVPAGFVPRAGDHLFQLGEPGVPGFRLLPGLPVPGRFVHPLLPLATSPGRSLA